MIDDRGASALLRGVVVALLAAVVTAMSGCTAALVDLGIRAERGRAHVERKVLHVVDHDIVYLERSGNDAVPALVLVHGFGGDKDNWTRMIQALPDDGRRIVALDLPGFGDSTKDPNARYDTQAEADRLAAFVDALGIGRFDLVGHSMGGHIATAYAIAHVDRLAHLVLMAPAGIASPRPSEVAQALARGDNPLLTHDAADFDRVLALLFVHPPSMPDALKQHFAERAAAARAFSDKVMRDRVDAPWSVEGQLGVVRVPVLVLWGAQDRVIDVSAAPLWRAALPDARVVVWEDCGHVPQLERPTQAADIVIAFLAGHTAAIAPSATAATH